MAAKWLENYHKNPVLWREKARVVRLKNPEKFKETQKRRWSKNREAINAKAREYARVHKSEKRAYRQANAERIKAANAVYRERTKEHRAKYNRDYYQQNREVVNERVRKCWEKNPELYYQISKAAKDRRRVRLLGGKSESFRRDEIFERDNWTCHICGESVDKSLEYPHPMSASLDHVKPVARGGDHVRENVACSHLRCNFKKKAKVLESAC